MKYIKEEGIDAEVSVFCSVCGQKFRMGQEVKQIVIGKLQWIKTVDDDGLAFWALAIANGQVADIHVSCIERIHENST